MLPIASLNTATLLGAELVGHSYGGGMLKIEPREADQLPIPSPLLVEHLKSELQKIRPAVPVGDHEDAYGFCRNMGGCDFN